MSAFFTKSMARNIFYGGTLFSVLLFLALTFHTTWQLPGRIPTEPPSQEVTRGKALWETRNCIGCHTLLGEGAYFAPELGNVYKRRPGTGQRLQTARPGLHQNLDQGATDPCAGTPTDAAIQLQRSAIGRSRGVPKMDFGNQYRKMATEHRRLNRS